jgi:hypothetical protein
MIHRPRLFPKLKVLETTLLFRLEFSEFIFAVCGNQLVVVCWSVSNNRRSFAIINSLTEQETFRFPLTLFVWHRISFFVFKKEAGAGQSFNFSNIKDLPTFS